MNAICPKHLKTCFTSTSIYVHGHESVLVSSECSKGWHGTVGPSVQIPDRTPTLSVVCDCAIHTGGQEWISIHFSLKLFLYCTLFYLYSYRNTSSYPVRISHFPRITYIFIHIVQIHILICFSLRLSLNQHNSQHANTKYLIITTKTTFQHYCYDFVLLKMAKKGIEVLDRISQRSTELLSILLNYKSRLTSSCRLNTSSV